MAFPQVATTNTSITATAGTSHTISLPASIASGDLLLAFIGGSSTGTVNYSNWTTGWTEFLDNGRIGGAYRIADGSEGSTISVTSSVSVRAAHNSYRINSWHGTTPPEANATSTSGSTQNPDPPSVTPSWGADDTLWIEIATNLNTTTISSASANYTNLIQVNSGGSGAASTKCNLGSARQELNATSEDPGTLTLGAAENWRANLVAIRPAAAAPLARRLDFVRVNQAAKRASFY